MVGLQFPRAHAGQPIRGQGLQGIQFRRNECVRILGPVVTMLYALLPQIPMSCSSQAWASRTGSGLAHMPPAI